MEIATKARNQANSMNMANTMNMGNTSFYTKYLNKDMMILKFNV